MLDKHLKSNTTTALEGGSIHSSTSIASWLKNNGANNHGTNLRSQKRSHDYLPKHRALEHQATDYRPPYLTLSLSLVVVLLGVLSQFLPVLNALCFDYLAISEKHQYWRLITGHLVHSSTSHLFWDLVTFTVCGSYIEVKEAKSRNLTRSGSPVRVFRGYTLSFYSLMLISSVLALDLYMLSPLSNIAQYSGLSGVLYAVAIFAAWQWFKSNSFNNKRRSHGYLNGKSFMAFLPMLGILGKTLFEILQKETAFVTQGWSLYYQAHLVGIVIGVIYILLTEYRQRNPASCHVPNE